VTDIKFGKYIEDFDDGLAQDWVPKVDNNWEVVSGEYKASSSSVGTAMQSMYMGQKWQNFSAQVTTRREGSSSNATVFAFRATEDFDWSINNGSGYFVGITDDGWYYVTKSVGGLSSWLQSWSYSPYLNVSGVSNEIMVNVEGTFIEVYFNGYLAWSGNDGDIPDEGRVLLMGYNNISSHYFDNVQIGESFLIQASLSEEQQWYNERPHYENATPTNVPEDIVFTEYPNLISEGQPPIQIEAFSPAAFRLENLPSLPITIPPLGNIVIDAIFNPSAVYDYSATVEISSNDMINPETVLLLTGFGIVDYLDVSPSEEEYLELARHPDGPFVPSNIVYHLTNNHLTESINWIASTGPMLTMSVVSGVLAPGESVDVTVDPNTSAYEVGEGEYPETVVFNNLLTGLGISREVNIRVYTAPKIWTSPSSGINVTLPQEETITEIFTVGNAGDSGLEFNLFSTEISTIIEGQISVEGFSTNGNEMNISVPAGHDFSVPANSEFKTEELLVRFAPEPNGNEPSIAKMKATVGNINVNRGFGKASIVRKSKLVKGLSLVKLPPGLTVQEALVSYNNAKGIIYAEPNYKIKLDVDDQTFPNDPRFDDLWGMHNIGQTGGNVDADIDAPEAWVNTTGNKDVIVALLDTGVDYTHVDLNSNIWINEAESNGQVGIDDDGNGYIDDIYGWDFADGDSDPMDYHYHGTHCAGTIGGIGNNEEGVTGVCWNVSIMPLKIFPNYGEAAFISGAIAAIEYAVNNGAQVMSNSWGGGAYSQSLKDEIEVAQAAGILFVAAAGNLYQDTDAYPHYPSSYDCDNLISVLATSDLDLVASFSNWGLTSVDLGAPGVSILSCEPGGSYQYLNGTSMSTPHVAGACALLLSIAPTMPYERVKEILIETVDQTLPGSCVSEGRMNLKSAIMETEASWIELTTKEGIVAPYGVLDINIALSAENLEVGIYNGQINVRSNDLYSPIMSVPVTMTIVPDPMTVSPKLDFEITGIAGGPFSPESNSYTLTNNDESSIDWTADCSLSWIDINTTAGTLAPFSSVLVEASVNSDVNNLATGQYSDVIVFTNMTSGTQHSRNIIITVTEPDYFSELFDSGNNDLDNQSLTFVSDGSGSFYSVCRKSVTEFGVDPEGGTILPLGDDDYIEVSLLGGASIDFFGQNYTSFYVGSNGYITFGTGDTLYAESLEGHFEFKRISALFDDLNPVAGGSVSWKQFSDKVVVTFVNVPELVTTNSNNFQIELSFDGSICITYLGISALDGLAGLSNGNGLPEDFIESDMSEYDSCLITGCFASDHPDYAKWVTVGQPASWCNPRQCHGDADGIQNTFGRGSLAWVSTEDAAILVQGYKQPYSGEPTVDPWIAADFDHTENTFGRGSGARVSVEDIDILLTYYKMHGVPDDCLDTP
jgi:subtilisin family serine protease